MRTRRIAIGCRRNGSTSTVAIAPSGSAGNPDPLSLDFFPVDPTWPPHLDRLPPTDQPRHPDRSPNADRPAASLPSRVRGTARAGANPVPMPAPPPPGDRDLTLADLTTGRRDLAWDRNPGWPVDVDWTTIARVARGHSPRHARRRLPALPARAFTWTGAGVITAVLLTILIITISELAG
jgi:hypothetical protein